MNPLKAQDLALNGGLEQALPGTSSGSAQRCLRKSRACQLRERQWAVKRLSSGESPFVQSRLTI